MLGVILKNKYIFMILTLFFILTAVFAHKIAETKLVDQPLKVYWFIPDGLRAEPEVFKIYEWAKNGELPNLKYMLDNGSYGYSRPVFPSHTPVNFASLMTGSWPEVHGVADGPMRLEGYPLSMILKGGFSSLAKKVPPIWINLEAQNNFVSLLSVPGSTPPELFNGLTIRGRWGGWGIEFPSVIFNSPSLQIDEEFLDQDKRVLGFSHQLTLQRAVQLAKNWDKKVIAENKFYEEMDLTYWGQALFVLIEKNSSSEKVNQMFFSYDKKKILFTLTESGSSPWYDCKLTWQTKNDYSKSNPKKTELENYLSEVSVPTTCKVTIIKSTSDSLYRIRMLYNSLNEYNVMPSEKYSEINKSIGPMVDFVDNYPPQLVFFDEDKKTFLNEMNESFEWHKKAVPFLIQNQKSNVVIHSVYNPNQMLTSRWWLPYVDPKSPKYKEVTDSQREKLWDEVKKMYKSVDNILGEVIKNADPNTYIIFGSDHGALPLWKEVRINNLFASKGWLSTHKSQLSSENEINWKASKVVFTQMNNVYINPNGLGGEYHRATGAQYEELRNEVIKALSDLKDPQTNQSVLDGVWKWENAKQIRLPQDRIGDLVIANSAYYSWTEHVTEKKEIFKLTLKGGYKQAVLNSRQELLTPFVIMGPKIKKNYQLKNIVNHVDQYPTLFYLLGYPIPNFVQGEIIKDIISD
jgi:predicted AlkP superfamily phosphohydrolase/phosphomutase